MPQVPSPEQLANAGPWAALAFVAIVVIAASFVLIRMLFEREFKRSDATEAELVATRKALDESVTDRLEAMKEIRRQRRVIATYEESHARPDRHNRRLRGRRTDDA